MDGQDRAAAAWEARKLMRAARHATLATLAADTPFASLVTPAIAPDGAVLMLLSTLSEHFRHLAANPRCSLLFAGSAASANPQTAPRVTVTGVAERCADPALKAHWLARHPYAALYAGFTDFALWRLVPGAGLYIGGFGSAARLSGDALAPDPASVASVAAAESRLVAWCNASRAGALGRLASRRGGSGAWTMIGLDCDGFDLVQDQTVLRNEFTISMYNAESVQSALMALLAEPGEDRRLG
jgi:putative heme iron utilization protein